MFSMSSFKRSQRKYVKKAYRVRNWREYEAGLRDRGSLRVWIALTDGKLASWDAPRLKSRKPGRPRKYSDHAIETAVTVSIVFGLASRQTEGFLRSLLGLLNLDNDVPDHTTISRRKVRLGKVPFYQGRSTTPVHILIDSSGLAVHVGQLRNPPRDRDYRKLHLCVDELTGDVIACDLTSKSARDSTRVASLVGQIDRPIASARADAAYDANGVYEVIDNHRDDRSPRVLIPPRRDAQLASESVSARERNRNIRARARLGKRRWHIESGYSKRSKVETTFHRYKAIVGPAMRARRLVSQRVEARIGCRILNTMTALGMPDGEMIV
jgi:transposase